MAVVARHEDCGQRVLVVDGEAFELSGAEHLCRDYLAWHRMPDRRDPADLDVPDGWHAMLAVVRGAVEQLAEEAGVPLHLLGEGPSR